MSTHQGASKNSATVFAPATVANVGVGFDILGFPFAQLGDTVTVTKVLHTREVVISGITGFDGLPLEAKANTATAGLIQLIEEQNLNFGFAVQISKGIPVGSGLGGSAASAVGAIVAANALLDKPLTKEQMVRYAMEGEFVASGSRHADNVAPGIYGGLVLIKSTNPVEIIELPWPQKLIAILVHPQLRLDTREARGVLKPDVSLKNHVGQSAHLAAFVAACFKNDSQLAGRAMVDLLIEPQRGPLIKGFAKVQSAARQAGALAMTISGSGPSVFAFVDDQSKAEAISKAMRDAFTQEGVDSRSWIAQLPMQGAKLI